MALDNVCLSLSTTKVAFSLTPWMRANVGDGLKNWHCQMYEHRQQRSEIRCVHLTVSPHACPVSTRSTNLALSMVAISTLFTWSCTASVGKLYCPGNYRSRG